MKPTQKLLIGAAASLAFAELWHGPLGASDRLTGHVERTARAQLNDDEMTQVQARLAKATLGLTPVAWGPTPLLRCSPPNLRRRRWRGS